MLKNSGSLFSMILNSFWFAKQLRGPINLLIKQGHFFFFFWPLWSCLWLAESLGPGIEPVAQQ